MSFATNAQVNFQVGDSTNVNADDEYPAPYGNDFDDSRHQMLFLASEMTAAGMSEGDITSIAFKVITSSGATLTNYEVQIKTTPTTSMGTTFEGGLTSVWGPQDQTDVGGWNTHTFTTPFYWDGVSNILVQTCNDNPNNSQNAVMVRTTTTFNSTIYRLTNQGNICGGGGGGSPIFGSVQRPVVRFGLNPLVAPPIAAFAPQGLFTCSNEVQFNDLSDFDPESWFWDFGDGDTDTVQDPLHIYLSDGTFDVTLIVTNQFGSDTITVTNAVTVNATGSQPVAACAPATQNDLPGFGVLAFSYADLNVLSGDGSVEGYADRGCIMDTVLAGSAFTLSLTLGNAAPQNVRAWVDWNNNGSFSSGELVLSADNVFTASGTVNVPASAVQNIPLRFRVAADYQLSPIPTACGAPQYGQVEDLGILVLPNTAPPEAVIGADPLVTCNGTVQFTDLSLNAPTAWSWDFGDTNTSIDQDPLHTYVSDGVYTVTFIAFNSFGSDTIVMTDLITVNSGAQLAPAFCTPATQSYCCGYGITGVGFVDISSTSVNGIEGYKDLSCEQNTEVTEGFAYPLTVTTGAQNAHDVVVWIDLNNDGVLTTSERMFQSFNSVNASGNINIPGGAVLNTPLRMRVAADVIGEITSSCSPPLFGQVEDYGVTILPNPNPPTAVFTANPMVTCDGVVQFFDQSTNAPITWDWDFGDTGSDTVPDPLHVYTDPGSYTVTLTVTNNNGTSSTSLTIQVLDATLCDTTLMSQNFNETVTECFGILTDDGGPNEDYSPGANGATTIAPPGAEQVTLVFQQFAYETNNDFLYIYDGPNTFSPLIGQFSGNGVGVLPNGGIISSTGGSITVQQQTTFGFINWAGFIANWSCSFAGVEEVKDDALFSFYPNPATDVVNIQLADPVDGITGYRIFDAVGALVRSEKNMGGTRSLVIDLGYLARGTYAIQLITDQGSKTRPFVLK